MRKILYGLSIIVAVTAVVVGATTAFYNDEETSAGNVLAAGSIDLGIDNTSYYNGLPNPGTSWALDWDLDVGSLDESGLAQTLPRLFFNFDDLKPGDWGEDTISLHVDDNASWLCADVTLTSNDDMSSTEPELDEVGEVLDDLSNNADGELASHVKFYWWADDGDNVHEDGETLLNDGVAFPGLGTYPVTLADSSFNIWGDEDVNQDPAPLPENSDIRYIGKAWCFGDGDVGSYPSQIPTPDPNDDPLNMVDVNTDPTVRPVLCDGSDESNITQTDSMTMDITFRAEQARHLPEFSCQLRDN